MFRTVLAILVFSGFAHSAMSLEQDVVDQAKSLAGQFDQFYNTKDTASLLNLFADDGVVNSPQVQREGRQELQALYEEQFQFCSNHVGQVIKTNTGPTLRWAIGTAIADCVIKNKPMHFTVRWSIAYDQTPQGPRIAVLTWNNVPPPAPPSEQK